MPIEVKPEGRFGNLLYETLERQNMDLKTLAREAETTYEHVRKLIKGQTYPSPYLMDNFTKVLKWDKKAAQLVADQDKAQKRFSKTFHTLTQKNPDLDPIEQAWPYLSDTSRKTIYSMIEVLRAQDTRDQVAKAAQSDGTVRKKR